MKLYDLDVSGNCYKVRLYSALTRTPLSIVSVDYQGNEHLQEPLICINPWGEIPILEDDGFVVRDSQAILCYLAKRQHDNRMLPADPKGFAHVMSWLSVAANEIHHSLEAMRLFHRFSVQLDEPLARSRSVKVLRLLDRHLSGQHWLVGCDATLADIAVFPYVALAHEGKIDIAPYRHVAHWAKRISELPGFVPMPGLIL